MHNFNLQEKTTSTVEEKPNFIKKFKAHFEKKLLYFDNMLKSRNYFFRNIKIFHGKANDLCM